MREPAIPAPEARDIVAFLVWLTCVLGGHFLSGDEWGSFFGFWAGMALGMWAHKMMK